MKDSILLSIFVLFALTARAQFAPQVGVIGTTAIHKDSNIFVNWATGCTLSRGWQNIADTSLGIALVGDESYVPGIPANGIVSLGDGGFAIVTFEKPLQNGPGYDFAVFENGFIDQTLKPGTAFLELAFVEVSSDGVHYFRFPSTSNTDTTIQIASFEGIDASKLNNLAGKYINNYGTPFDLNELANIDSLDIQRITHIKIIDVVGSISRIWGSLDSKGNLINDPWPTAFPSSGFDLDAIGVIHQRNEIGLKKANETIAVNIFPKPAKSNQPIYLNFENEIPKEIFILNTLGQIVMNKVSNLAYDSISLPNPGVYIILIQNKLGSHIQKILIH